MVEAPAIHSFYHQSSPNYRVSQGILIFPTSIYFYDENNKFYPSRKRDVPLKLNNLPKWQMEVLDARKQLIG